MVKKTKVVEHSNSSPPPLNAFAVKYFEVPELLFVCQNFDFVLLNSGPFESDVHDDNGDTIAILIFGFCVSPPKKKT